MGKSAEYRALIKQTSSQLRGAQSDIRFKATDSKSAVQREFGSVDLSGYNLHISEGDRAFNEGESAEKEQDKRKWFARAVLEYNDAIRAIDDERKSKELVPMVTTSGTGGAGPFSPTTAETGADAERTAAEGSARADAETAAVTQAAKDAIKSVGSGLSDLIFGIAIAYFMTEAFKGALVSKVRNA